MKQDALLPWRKKAMDRYLEKPFQVPEPAVRKEIELTSSADLTFIDGFPTSHHLADALKTYGLFLQNRWTKVPVNPYTALNHALADGAFLYVPSDTKTLRIHHIFTTDKLSSPRLQITVGKNAELTLIQTYEYRAPSFVNLSIDVACEPGAKCTLYDYQLKSSQFFSTFRATLKRDSTVSVFYGTDGGYFSATAELLEPNSSFTLQGLAMLHDRNAEIHAHVEHVAPNCTSRQHIKTALNGQSKSTFDGKIYVHAEAQKTEAYQLNNNLLLSKSSTAVTHPNLEIFADDVKASHGATVAQLSDEELFYLRTRGITEGKILLTHAFCRELIDLFPEKEPLLTAMKEVLRA